MRVTIDRDLCQGHARCWQICPEVFSLDEEGSATLNMADVPQELQDPVSQAAANCPERAITLD